MALRRTAALAITACAVSAAVAAGPAGARLPEAAVRAVERVTPEHLRGYVEKLASDELGGRAVGTPGNRATEEYVCAALRDNGVTPAGAEGSCFDPVRIYRSAPGAAAALRVTREDGTPVANLTLGADFYPLPESGNAVVAAPLVFARHGLVLPDRKHDDYKGVNAQGAIVLVLDGAPDGLTETSSSVETKIGNASAHGARALIVISDTPADYRLIWPERAAPRDEQYRLLSGAEEFMPVAALSARGARPIRRMLDDGSRLTATLTPDVAADAFTIRNVLGIVEGKDPARRGELVVVGAHLDHDGTDAQGRIYNGADDNASGTAAVLAAAGVFARAAADGERPARSVLFALWNGEEKGSLGAEAFVTAPRAGRQVIANLNLDMVGRHEEIPDPANWRWSGLPKVDRASSGNTLHVLGYSYSPDLAAEVRDANDGVGLQLLEDYDEGAQDLLRRSDHWAFVSHGIPALFLTTGLHPDYHTPDDDVERIDFGKLARVARLAARAAWIVSDGPAPALKKR